MKRPVDSHGNHRSRIVGFDVSKEERELMDRRAIAAGMSRSEYIAMCLESREFSFIPNQKVYDALLNKMNMINIELARMQTSPKED